MIPAIPIALEFAVELTFPINEALTIGVMFAGGNLWGFILGEITGTLDAGLGSESETQRTCLALFGFYLIAIFLTIFIK